MDDAVVADVCSAVDGLRRARRSVADAFGVSSAAGLVRRVLDGEVPRQGRLPDGMEYFVHGVGYTVVHDNGAQAHIDACAGETGDCFTAYDVHQFLQDAGGRVPSPATIREVCDGMVRRGQLGSSGEAAYMVLDPDSGCPASGVS